MMSVLRRPILLLSVIATVTVPGALAAFAVLGHDGASSPPAPHAGAIAARSGGQRAASLAAGAASDGLLPGLMQAGGAQPGDGMRAGAAAGLLTQARDQARGLLLLEQAAKSGAVTSYEGVEVISDVAVGGSTSVVSSVWHDNGVTVTRTATGQGASAARAGSQSYVSYDAAVRHDSEGVFGVTTTLVGLLAKNYVAMYQGQGTAAGRPAFIVAVRRANGSLAAQFWLDKRTMLPLRKDVFDTHAHLVSDERFVRVHFGRMPPPPAGKSSTARAAASTWATVPVPAAFLKKMDSQGWLLPGALPGNLELYAAAQTSTPSGQVIDLGFSDGLSVVSLFVQRGTLPAKMPGWQPIRIGGHTAYADGHEVTLTVRGFVYTLVADAPVPVVDEAVAALPSKTGTGVLGRIGRGLSRLMTMADPFN